MVQPVTKLRAIMRAMCILVLYSLPPTFLSNLARQIAVSTGRVSDDNPLVVIFSSLGIVISVLYLFVYYSKRGIIVSDFVDLNTDALKRFDKIKTVLSGIFLGFFVSSILTILPKSFLLGYDVALTDKFRGESKIIPILIVLFLSPFAEEFLFRGILFKTLSRAFKPNNAVFITALMFGLVHGYIVWFVYAFLFGLLFGFLNVKKKSLLPSALMHFGVNLAALPGMLLVNTKFDPAKIHKVYIFLAAVALAVAAFYMIDKIYRERRCVAQ